MAAGTQKFCLQWNEFRGIVTSAFYNLRQDEDFVDVTLCCEGRQIKAHRMMLSACSQYFKTVLKGVPCQHPVFFMKDVSYSDLAAVIEFVYTGEVNVSQNNLSSFLKTAEMLQVKGLANDSLERSTLPSSHDTQSPTHPSRLTPPPLAQPTAHPAKRQGSIDTPILSPPTAKRGRLDPTSGSRAPPAPVSAGPPSAGERGRAYPAEWVTPEQPELADLPPPPPPPDAAAAADSGAHQGVTVKTEMGVHDDGHSVDPSLDADAGYGGLLDLKVAEQALAASVDGGAGAPSRTFFGEDASGGSYPSQDISSWLVGVGGGGDPSRPPAAGLDRRTCRLCHKVFRHRESLCNHMEMHRGFTTCPRCGKVLSTKKSLRLHLNRRCGAAVGPAAGLGSPPPPLPAMPVSPAVAVSGGVMPPPSTLPVSGVGAVL